MTMPTKGQYDVIIIGTGAGGGTLAPRLAPSGKRVLLLERGDYVPREKGNWSTRTVGLANSSDVVGRHYMGHINSVLMAVSKCPNPTVFQKTLAVNHFYLGSKEWNYPMGHSMLPM
jgi:choline dehydrogenase-like flavoprotein